MITMMHCNRLKKCVQSKIWIWNFEKNLQTFPATNWQSFHKNARITIRWNDWCSTTTLSGPFLTRSYSFSRCNFSTSAETSSAFCRPPYASYHCKHLSSTTIGLSVFPKSLARCKPLCSWTRLATRSPTCPCRSAIWPRSKSSTSGGTTYKKFQLVSYSRPVLLSHKLTFWHHCIITVDC